MKIVPALMAARSVIPSPSRNVHLGRYISGGRRPSRRFQQVTALGWNLASVTQSSAFASSLLRHVITYTLLLANFGFLQNPPRIHTLKLRLMHRHENEPEPFDFKPGSAMRIWLWCAISRSMRVNLLRYYTNVSPSYRKTCTYHDSWLVYARFSWNLSLGALEAFSRGSSTNAH